MTSPQSTVQCTNRSASRLNEIRTGPKVSAACPKVGAEVFLETSDGVELPQLPNIIAGRQEMLFNVAGVLLVNDHEHVDNLEEHAERIFSQLMLSATAISTLEEATRNQSVSDTWYAEHVG